MHVAIRSSSATAVTTGILLLTHAKRLGQPIQVVIDGDANDFASVLGPAMVHSPVLSGCGVGRVPKTNGLVCVPGRHSEPLVVSLERGGLSDWFTVDRDGQGVHPATREFIALCRSTDPELQAFATVLRGALSAMGCPAEPALLDVLFGAPAPPIERLALTIRAGRAMTGGSRDLLTGFIKMESDGYPDPLPTPLTMDGLLSARESGHIAKLLDRVNDDLRASVSDWFDGLAALEDGCPPNLLCGIAEVGSHLLSLPLSSVMPTLGAERAGLAAHLGRALGAASGEHCAMASLVEMYTFLGGRFVDHSAFAVDLPSDPPPSDRIDRWQWLCQSAFCAKEQSESLWQQLIDPVQ